MFFPVSRVQAGDLLRNFQVFFTAYIVRNIPKRTAAD